MDLNTKPVCKLSLLKADTLMARFTIPRRHQMGLCKLVIQLP